MTREVCDGFSIDLAGGWAAMIEESTFVDADEQIPFTFHFLPSRAGRLQVAAPMFEDGEQPGATTGDVEELAREFGERRGIAAPVELSSRAESHASIATAVYRVGGDFVQVWFISNGKSLIAATYSCAWAARYDEQAERESIVASLRFD